jgi:hypothetical protein
MSLILKQIDSLPYMTVALTLEIVSPIPGNDEVFSIQNYVIKKTDKGTSNYLQDTTQKAID